MKFNQIKDSLTKEEVDRCMKAFVTTDTIDVRDAIDIQAIFQKYIDHSISKTANLPNDYTFEQYKDLFMYAWKKGLKGFTSFNPNGSLKGILETSNNSSTTITIVNNRPTEIVDTHAPKRPDVLNCHIHQTTIKGTKWVFFVGILNNRPYEILGGKEEYINIPKKYIKGVDTINSWIVKKKVGSDTHYNLVIGSLDKASDDYQLFENIAKIFPVEMGTPTRLISSLLRHGMPIKDIMLQLEKVPQEDSLYTFESGIKRVLKHYIKDGIDSKDICTECKSKMVFENGCKVCKNCGNSKCG
jgi:ribonucleoside-diphosphate reductase alpha chain